MLEVHWTGHGQQDLALEDEIQTAKEATHVSIMRIVNVSNICDGDRVGSSCTSFLGMRRAQK